MEVYKYFLNAYKTVYRKNKMDDEYIFHDNEGELRPDFNALTRAEIFNEDIRDIQDRTQRFKSFLSVVATEIKDIRSLGLETQDINFLLDSVSKISNPGYKNPTAYILGYLLIKKGCKKQTLEKIIVPILNQLSYSVNPHDVIRYSRLLQKLTPV